MVRLCKKTLVSIFWLQTVNLIHPSRLRNGMEYGTNLRFSYTLVYHLRFIAHTLMNRVASSFTLMSQDFDSFSHPLIWWTTIQVSRLTQSLRKTWRQSPYLEHEYTTTEKHTRAAYQSVSSQHFKDILQQITICVSRVTYTE